MNKKGEVTRLFLFLLHATLFLFGLGYAPTTANWFPLQVRKTGSCKQTFYFSKIYFFGNKKAECTHTHTEGGLWHHALIILPATMPPATGTSVTVATAKGRHDPPSV
ncbi:hypothetical protein TW95_gp0379 [Pandoravirus inopinatum]|uniref:Uncharacterized protein n=1 Tax=Pandoravirus inopinatum TaxID=1605721 RepID=A0A0B5IWN5_9VIRU|nr:hypothetical protein TW95_gp0379 [Pandoravirus inopinatum]AJF97113.1 hypothetical protein [Pandoravirus inopinatum]